MKRLVQLVLAAWYGLIERIQEARRPPKRKRDDDHVPVYVPRAMGPVVESPQTKYPVPLTRVPLRSTSADSKRRAHAYAEHRVGHELSWKRARRLLNQWEREERMAEHEIHADQKKIDDLLIESTAP